MGRRRRGQLFGSYEGILYARWDYPGEEIGSFTITLNREDFMALHHQVIRINNTTWVQRDLEDQIAEEKAALAAQTKKPNMARQTKDIKTAEVLDLLSKGYVRYKKDDEGFGSIQEHYGLTGVEVSEVFQHPKLRGVKTKFPSRIRFIDDEEPQQEEAKKEEPQQEKAEDDVFS